MEGVITLPWPDKALHPNARVHWAAKAKAAKAARTAAGWAAKVARVRVEGEGRVTLNILFKPPSRRRHDIDNCLAACKSALDGIADALGINDCRFRFVLEIGEPVKGGVVVVGVET